MRLKWQHQQKKKQFKEAKNFNKINEKKQKQKTLSYLESHNLENSQ